MMIVFLVNVKVFDIIYCVGECFFVGKLIISLLFFENIKVCFFIFEVKFGKFKIGFKVKFICDGCVEFIVGVINYISFEVEFMFLVIYSMKCCEKFIFMVEVIFVLQQVGWMKIG